MVTQITAYNSEGKIWNLLVKISEYTNIDGTKEKVSIPTSEGHLVLDFQYNIIYYILSEIINMEF